MYDDDDEAISGFTIFKIQELFVGMVFQWKLIGLSNKRAQQQRNYVAKRIQVMMPHKSVPITCLFTSLN